MGGLKKIFKRVKVKAKPLIGSALRSGATNIGNQLRNMARDINQTSDFHLGKLTNAVKSGIIATGKEMMSSGLDRVKAIAPEDQKSNISE